MGSYCRRPIGRPWEARRGRLPGRCPWRTARSSSLRYRHSARLNALRGVRASPFASISTPSRIRDAHSGVVSCPSTMPKRVIAGRGVIAGVGRCERGRPAASSEGGRREDDRHHDSRRDQVVAAHLLSEKKSTRSSHEASHELRESSLFIHFARRGTPPRHASTAGEGTRWPSPRSPRRAHPPPAFASRTHDARGRTEGEPRTSNAPLGTFRLHEG